jgi:penicillin-insensitive murein DD-endopeptidase
VLPNKLIFAAFLAVTGSGHVWSRSSVCHGTSASGRLENGVSLPLAGPNFASHSALGWLLGREYVHSRVHRLILAAYARLAQAAPDKTFVFGETGWSLGGKFPPHKTHQNGLSVDFMVPVTLGGRSVPLPTSLTNQFGYGIEFDDSGRWGAYRIDFEALAEHLYQLSNVGRKQGVDIARVIFEVPLQRLLWKTTRGAYLRENLKFSTRRAWVRHDEHYHVDFQISCKP